jgi:hypothetical protein
MAALQNPFGEPLARDLDAERQYRLWFEEADSGEEHNEKAKKADADPPASAHGRQQ